MPNAPHAGRQRHGWSPVPVILVPARAPQVFTRAQVAGFAHQEAQANEQYGHGDQPSDLYWSRELARLDATLSTIGSAA